MIKKEDETLYPSSSAMLRELVHHFPLLSVNCFDVKMMVGGDNGYAIVNIESFSS